MPLKKLIKWNEEKFIVINVVVLVTVKTLNKKGKITMIGFLAFAWVIIWYANQ
ncbi:MAG: hypothetical protein QGF80_03190 [Pelagibacteraceae bacterium]|jgi:hypothetical protein|nr:hypothetical protein [Pelagibacteraceae bacterium]MDP6710424.1 hypothetical protein [Pelagibacteraceae bacterium]|tara:strand:- start:1580 stop:1738 length:159 start_codon:yes stop_codon:yes gene_type:complete